MYYRKVPPDLLETFRQNLNAKARREPLDVSYNCDMTINGERYRLRLLMERSRVYPFQAIRLCRDIRNCELITRPSMLAALTEFLIEQYSK